jgi:multiple sugar transport system ATP-binding protein
MAEVILERVSRGYPGGIQAVRELDLAVADRELLVLVGPSGCGKTTVLRLIAGLERPNSGEIRIGGRSVKGVSPKDRNVAMVFQDLALYPHLSVAGNLAFGLELRRHRRVNWPAGCRAGRSQAIFRRVARTAGLLGIEPLLGRWPQQLSGGERQRVALGRAIVRRPAAFLFDEPFSNLDAHLRADLRRVLKQLHQRLRRTMLFVTHDQREAMVLGDRIAVMHQGRIQQTGQPTQLYERPANLFVAGFLGVPAMNLVSGRLARCPEGLQFVGGGLKVDLSETVMSGGAASWPEAVVMGVRPEDLQMIAEEPRSESGDAVDGVRIQGIARCVGQEFDGTVHYANWTVLRNDARPLPGQPPQAVDLVSRLERTRDISVGSNFALRVNVTRLHLFDAGREIV